MAAARSSFEWRSHRSWSSWVPTNIRTYFMTAPSPGPASGRRPAGSRPCPATPWPWPAPVEVGHLDLGVAADHLFGLDERTVSDRDLAVSARDRGCGARALQLVAADDLSGLRVLLEPLPRLLVVGHRLLFGRALELVRTLHRAAEQ